MKKRTLTISVFVFTVGVTWFAKWIDKMSRGAARGGEIRYE